MIAAVFACMGFGVGVFGALIFMHPNMRFANDRIDGLEAELRMAVLCAYLRGAKEWAVMNYPDWKDWLESHEDYAQ